jgi:hypothetical protein
MVTGGRVVCQRRLGAGRMGPTENPLKSARNLG